MVSFERERISWEILAIFILFGYDKLLLKILAYL